MMDEVNSIERYRKKRKRVQNRKRFVTLIVLIGIGAALYLTSGKWMGFLEQASERLTEFDGSSTLGFPITLTGSAKYDMQRMGSGIAVLTDTYIYAYNSNGKREVSQQHNYSNPIMQVSGHRMLLYDKGAYSLLVRSKSAEVFSKSLAEKIMLARISSKDYVAVVTESSRYNAEMVIYNNRGDEIFTWYSDYKILDIQFTPDSKGAVVSAITAHEGKFLTKLYRFDFSSEQELWTADIPGSMIFALNIVSKDVIIATGDNAILRIDKDGTIIEQVPYSAEITGYSESSSVVALEFYDSRNRNILITCAYAGATAHGVINELDSGVKDIYADASTVCVLMPDTLVVYNADMEQLKNYDLEDEYEQIIAIGDYYYLLGDKAIIKFRK